MTWHKADKPLIAMPPADMPLVGWRDPYIFEVGGSGRQWGMLMGSGLKGRGGAVMIYRSNSLLGGALFLTNTYAGAQLRCIYKVSLSSRTTACCLSMYDCMRWPLESPDKSPEKYPLANRVDVRWHAVRGGDDGHGRDVGVPAAAGAAGAAGRRAADRARPPQCFQPPQPLRELQVILRSRGSRRVATLTGQGRPPRLCCRCCQHPELLF